jgi:hypothetical protein
VRTFDAAFDALFQVELECQRPSSGPRIFSEPMSDKDWVSVPEGAPGGWYKMASDRQGCSDAATWHFSHPCRVVISIERRIWPESADLQSGGPICPNFDPDQADFCLNCGPGYDITLLLLRTAGINIALSHFPQTDIFSGREDERAEPQKRTRTSKFGRSLKYQIPINSANIGDIMRPGWRL